MKSDTICAIATGNGGAIGIVRVSGEEAITITEAIFKSSHLLKDAKSQTLSYGQIIDEKGTIVDDVLVSVFRAPHSYTGENSTEISCHNSPYILQKILTLLINAGCRLADHGEYTQRAFLNGKMDLSQAEAVADLIASTSSASHQLAMNQMRGGFTKEFRQLREKLLHISSLMELELDFSDHEELQFADRSELKNLLDEIIDKIGCLVHSFQYGNAIKNGIPVAIVGDTNVGKSTLLNSLVGEERAIVSDIEGTTRDTIEDTVNIKGFVFRFIDTAGIRQTSNSIEQLGIERSLQKIEQASIILWVVDASQINATIELPALLSKQNKNQTLIIFNKSDLISLEQSKQIEKIAAALPYEHLFMSAKVGNNLYELKEKLLIMADIPQINNNEFIVTNLRHFEALRSALYCAKRTQKGLLNNVPTDLVSQDLHECLQYLSDIVGEITSTDVIHSIFSHFCIGK